MVEKDSWIHITEAKKFESLLVRVSVTLTALTLATEAQGLSTLQPLCPLVIRSLCLGRIDSSQCGVQSRDT